MVREVKLIDIAEMERAKTGKIYKAGSIYFPMSAVSEISEVGFLEEDKEVDGRNAVATPMIECVPKYFHIAVVEAFPSFIRRYATTINIQADVLSEFRLIWHPRIEEQEEVVRCIGLIDKEIRLIEEQIELEKEAKKIFLNYMFP